MEPRGKSKWKNKYLPTASVAMVYADIVKDFAVKVLTPQIPDFSSGIKMH